MAKREKNKKAEKKVMEDEIFHVEKNGKEETIRKEIFEEEKIPSKTQVKKENKIFIGVVVAMACFVVMFLVFYLIVNYSVNFEYKGVKFKTIKAGELLLYNTFLPVKFNNSIAEYNFYLRTDPRTIESMTFKGDMQLRKAMVMNFTNQFNCEGQGVVATANFVNLQKIIGTDVMQDDNATCDDEGRYSFVRLLAGNETKITEFGKKGGCYDIEIKDCEILKGMEKFMLETFVEVNRKFDL